MKALLVVLALAVACGLLTGCAGMVRAPVSPGMGLIFSDYDAPLDIDADPTVVAMKMGQASAENILGLVITGDASIQEAAKQGGISKVHHVDYHYKNILGIYAKFTTTVYGE